MPAYQSGGSREIRVSHGADCGPFEINGERIENLELIELEK